LQATDQTAKTAHPPVIERVACFFADLSEELFARNLDIWLGECGPHFNEHIARPHVSLEFGPRTNADLDVTPQAPSMKVQIKHWCLKKFETGAKDACLVVPETPESPGLLSLSILRGKGPNRARSFHELSNLAHEWLPKWAAIFGVEKFKFVRLHYINILRSDTTPSLAANDGVRVGQALTIFKNFPIAFTGVHDPLNWQVRLDIESKLLCQVEIRIRGIDPVVNRSTGQRKTSDGVQVDLMAESFPTPQRQIGVQEALADLSILHDHVTGLYQGVFTDEARETFVLS